MNKRFRLILSIALLIVLGIIWQSVGFNLEDLVNLQGLIIYIATIAVCVVLGAVIIKGVIENTTIRIIVCISAIALLTLWILQEPTLGNMSSKLPGIAFALGGIFADYGI